MVLLISATQVARIYCVVMRNSLELARIAGDSPEVEKYITGLTRKKILEQIKNVVERRKI